MFLGQLEIVNDALTFLSGDSTLKALWQCRTLGKQRVWGSQPERSSRVQLGVPDFLFFLIRRGGRRRTVCRWHQLHGCGVVEGGEQAVKGYV